MAPAGTVSVRVLRHRSHIKQRKGHSRLVIKTVATGSIVPVWLRSCSTKYSYGICGSRASRAGRRLSIQASRSVALDGYTNGNEPLIGTEREIFAGTPLHEREAGQASCSQKLRRAGSAAWRIRAFRSR